MFEFNKEKLNEEKINRKAEHEAHKMFTKMLAKMLLESDAPENIKLSVQVTEKVKDLIDMFYDSLIKKYCTPEQEADTETLKKVFEYLGLVEIGLNQFLETME